MSSTTEALKWRVYFGEDPEAGESEDEDFCGGRAGGYTRDEIAERDRKWKVVEDFEKGRAGVEVLKPPAHRSLCGSVRPAAGAEAVVTYAVEDREGREIAGATRAVLVVADPVPADEPWRGAIDAALLDMRRGEAARVDCGEGRSAAVELHFVREERVVAPRPSTNPWCPPAAQRTPGPPLTSGAARKKRVALGRLTKDGKPHRPRFGDRVRCRVAQASDDVAEDALVASLKTTDAKVRELGGDHDLCEGVETALLSMRPGEAAVVVASGEFSLSEGAPAGSGALCRFAVELEEILDRVATEEGHADAFEAAGELKARGSTAARAGKWRRAEALYTRAIQKVQEAIIEWKPPDEAKKDVERDLVVPLLLNVALCARKRRTYADEDVCLTKALGFAPRSRDAFPLVWYARAHLRRGAARADLERWADAVDDLKRAALDAKTVVEKKKYSDDDKKAAKSVYRDVRLTMDRLQKAKAAKNAAEKKTGIFAGLKQSFTDEPDGPIDVTDAADPTAVSGPKKAPLLYGKEIDDRLRKTKPWLHDPAYYDGRLKRAVHANAPAPVALREDDLQGQFDDMDAYEEEQEKLSTMLKRNLTMHQMYDCNGTGKRGGQMPRGENPFQAGGMIRMD